MTHPGLIGGYFLPRTVVQLSKPSCFECTVTTWHMGKASEDEDVCRRLPEQSRPRCHSLMATYGQAMRLLQAAGEDKVCQRLQICHSGLRDPLEEQAAMPTPELQVARRQDDSCTLCHMVFDQVR